MGDGTETEARGLVNLPEDQVTDTASGADTFPVQRRASMFIRLALFVAALVILTAGLMSWAGYVVARNIIRDQIHERLRVAGSDRHAMVMSFVEQQLERVGLVASRTKLRNTVAEFEHGQLPEQAMRAGTRPILEDALRSTNGFRVISIASPEGRVLTSTSDALLDTDVSGNSVFQAGLKGRHLGEPVFDNDLYVTSVAAPARTNDGELLGVVLVELDATPLFRILTDTEGLGETGRVFVGTRDGDRVRYLFRGRESSGESVQLSEVPAMAAAIGGATRSEVTSYAGVDVLVHYRPIEYQPLDYRPWGLVARMDVAEAYAPLDDFRRTRLWTQFGLVIAGLAGSLWVSRRITEPIRELTSTATAVAGGDLSAQVLITTNDEIGALGRTFNTMTRKLQASYATLEDRVRQRTAELSSEIARREAAQHELQQHAERIKRIIDTANEGFVSMDAEGFIVEWNPEAENMFGWSRDEAMRLKVSEIIIPKRFRQQHEQGLARFLATREAAVLNQRVELTALRRDGTEFPIEATITPQRLDDGLVFNAFLHDITQRKQDEQALHDAREQAESASRSKSEFLANMSHEIRTPMNGIIGMSELLANTKLEPDQRDYLKMVQQSASALLLLLNDILDFSKIEAGKLELERLPFSLRECIGNTGHTLSSQAAEKGIELACRIAPEIPDILIGDPGRLRQIVVNLAGNAIKFTEAGEVVIEITRLADDSRSTSPGEDSGEQLSGDVTLNVSVRDTGIGIPADKLDVIFEAFGQADASTTRQYGGTGLGLAISTQLVQLMNGKIDVESELGKGTTFSFTAQFGVSPEQKLRPSSDLMALRDTPVLVVDDNDTNRRILHEILTSWSMLPVTVGSGAEGLRYIERTRGQGQNIPLVLLDCMMPDMDGFQFARRLRETVPETECTIIMISSSIQAGDSERCRQLEIARCMPKPVMHSDLLNTILMEIHPERLPESGAGEIQVDGDVIPRRILLAEDGAINQRVAVGFLERRGHHVTVVSDGKQALDAVDREAFDVVLMDVQMPTMDGFAATSAIRQREAGTGCRLPIVAMTANAMKGDRERCLEAGMDDYVPKPVEPEALFRAVESFPAAALTPAKSVKLGEETVSSNNATRTESAVDLEPAEVTDSSGVSESPLPSTQTPSEPLIDWERCIERMPGGIDLAKELAAMLIDEAPKYLEQLETACQNSDADTLRRAAHTLKGSAAIFAVKPLVEQCQEIEERAQAGDTESCGPRLHQLNQLVAELSTELVEFINSH